MAGISQETKAASEALLQALGGDCSGLDKLSADQAEALTVRRPEIASTNLAGFTPETREAVVATLFQGQGEVYTD